MRSVFEKEGIPVELGKNRPLRLAESRSVWWIRSGKADVFAVHVADGKPVGMRTHLLRLEEGQALFGFGEYEEGKGLELIAVGDSETSLLKLSLRRLSELDADSSYSEAIEDLIHTWITGLSLKLREQMPPKVCEEIKTGEELVVEDGKNLRPSTGILWVRHLEGASLFMGGEDISSLHEEGFFPLSDQAWLQTVGQVRLLAVNTQSLLLQDPSWDALERFHRFVLDSLVRSIEKENREERRRLALKEANEMAALESALSHISGLLQPEKAQKYDVGEESDPLLAVCKLVGMKAGIEVNPPPQEAMKTRRYPLDIIARSSRFRIREVVLTEDWWRKDHGPLLGYMESDKRPVALLPTSPRSYELYDPASHSCIKVTADIAPSLSPKGYTFYRPFPEHFRKGWQLFTFGLRGCWGDLGIIILMALIVAIVGLLTPIATGIIYSKIIPQSARNQLAQITIILITCAVTTSMFEVTKAVAILRLESKMDASMQSGVMDRLLTLPVPFFRDYTTGDLADRTLGINAMRLILSGVTTQAMLSGIFSSFNFFLLFWYDWHLALVATVVIFIGITCTSILGYLHVRYQRQLSGMQGKISGLVLQFITGIAKLRISGTEDRAFEIWAKEFTEQKRISLRIGLVGNILATFNAAFPTLALMAIFAWVGIMEVNKIISAGNFAAFNSAYTSFQNAVLQMSLALMATLNILPLYERVKPILETLPEVHGVKASPGELSGDIEVNHVFFRYSPNGPLILNDVSLSIRPGQFVALVGGSGSGKSTLFRLLLGFETPESGTIYYDDQDLSTLDITDVRRQIGVVLQNGRVMGGDIFKNIVGSLNLTLQDAWEAARMSGLEEDIKQMPMGMHTVVSAGGGTLSGGQRQRLLIARAIVHRPRILFFDEATSALDNQTQAVVSESLEKLQATRVVIAHRLSTIINADLIYVLERGRIVQSGTYDELIRKKGPFAELAKRQIA